MLFEWGGSELGGDELNIVAARGGCVKRAKRGRRGRGGGGGGGVVDKGRGVRRGPEKPQEAAAARHGTKHATKYHRKL